MRSKSAPMAGEMTDMPGAAEDQVASESSTPIDARSRGSWWRRRWRRLAMIGGAGVLVVAVLLEAVLLSHSSRDERSRLEATNLSRQFLVVLTTYNQSTLAQQRKQVLALSTGRFRTEYQVITGETFTHALGATQADSRGSVERVAITSLEGDAATALAVLRVSATNKDLETPRVQLNVIELSLVRTADGWKVDGVTIVGTLG